MVRLYRFPHTFKTRLGVNECRILVQLVDEYRPGWDSRQQGLGARRLEFSLSRIYTVELMLVQPGWWSRERNRFVKMDYEEMGRFQFFHRSKGMNTCQSAVVSY